MFMGLTILAFFLKTDITYCTGMIAVVTWALIFMTILLFMFPGRGVMIGACTGCIVIIGIFIIYDTQAIASRSKYGLDYDDYIIGAILLYTDIITLFLFLLTLLSLLRGSG
mmetsp:Transcript_35066/g.34096  ORF Transcript_35066/g.34096 Transcript_35066/m.34096 type:complete len:111 (+) Transcript_35066:865-1197(+)